jgi:hypothetical protein
VPFRKGELDDLDRRVPRLAVLQEDRVDDMVGNRLDKREVLALRQRGRRGVLEVHIVFGHVERRVRPIMWGAIQQHAHTDPQRLRQVRFLGIDAGQDIHFQVLDLEHQHVVHGDRCAWVSCHACLMLHCRGPTLSFLFHRQALKAPARALMPGWRWNGKRDEAGGHRD